MANSYFPFKALTTVALLFFLYDIFYYTADAIKFVWVGIDYDHEDSDFEDFDTLHFPLPEKCPTPPHYELPPPYEGN